MDGRCSVGGCDLAVAWRPAIAFRTLSLNNAIERLLTFTTFTKARRDTMTCKNYQCKTLQPSAYNVQCYPGL
jgi:hypothetical protein